MRSFAEILAETMGGPEPCQARAPGPEPGRPFDAVHGMLAAATALEIEAPCWAKTLGVRLPCTREDLKRAFRKRAFEAHPDRPGGSHEAFLAATRALEEGLAALAAPRAHEPVLRRARYAS